MNTSHKNVLQDHEEGGEADVEREAQADSSHHNPTTTTDLKINHLEHHDEEEEEEQEDQDDVEHCAICLSPVQNKVSTTTHPHLLPNSTTDTFETPTWLHF